MSTGVTDPPDTASPRTVASPRANRPVLEIVLYVAAAVGVLWWLGGWPVPFVILAIILMVVLHELGHFLTARLTGMKATEFFVGFGPRLWSRRVGETEVGVKAIWAGGYVRILGMTMIEELDVADEPKSFRQATFPRRVLVASAGSLVHLLLALVLAWGVILALGNPGATGVQVASFATWAHHSQTAAQAGGLLVNDVIVSVNHHPVTSESALAAAISARAGKPTPLGVIRGGRRLNLWVTPANAQKITEHFGSEVVAPAKTKTGIVGIAMNDVVVHTPTSLLASVPDAFGYLGSTISAIAAGMYHVFNPVGISTIVHADVSPQVATSQHFTDTYRPTSIYGIAKWAVQIAKQNPSDLLVLFMVLNLAVGLMNMLPMLPLDGGYVAVAIYERIRTRRGRPAYHADVTKLTPVIYAFVALLLVLALSSLYLDIVHPINL